MSPSRYEKPPSRRASSLRGAAPGQFASADGDEFVIALSVAHDVCGQDAGAKMFAKFLLDGYTGKVGRPRPPSCDHLRVVQTDEPPSNA